MTLRDSLVRTRARFNARKDDVGGLSAEQSDRTARNLTDRLRQKRRRQDRRMLSESLEPRQLLAGPDLIGIQPNEGSLLSDNVTLNVSPRELVFRFDDDANIDPNTLSAIRITRAGEDGVFESATATSDLGTNGQVLVEFRSVQTGSLGNGVQIVFEAESRAGSSLPIVTVSDRTINVNVNSNPSQPTRVQDLISVLNNNSQASSLVEAIQVSGPSQGVIGTQVPDGLSLTLIGANAAEGVTDFGTNGAVRVRVVSELPGVEGRGTRLEIERVNFGGQANPVVVVTGQTIRVQLNSNPAFPSTAEDFINAINSNPDASALVTAVLQEGRIETPIGNGTSAIAPLTLGGVTDVVVEPGFVGLGDSPREVVFRFAEPLPDDQYQIDILGTGTFALRNADGELFQDGEDLTRRFSINLGPKVVAVVPEPVRRDPVSGALSPQVGKIEVHFNEDDLDKALAETQGFYQLIFTRDTATNRDDVVVPLINKPVYNNITNVVTLDYGRPLSRIPDPANAGSFLSGAVRLRVGSSEGLATRPTMIPTLAGTDQAGDTFDGAFDLGTSWAISPTRTSSARLNSEIFNATPFTLDLPGPDVPGTRQIRPDDPSRLERTVPLDYLRNGADAVDGISIIQYDFAPSWIGDDPTSPGINEDKTYFNIISEQQKQRVREVMSLYSEYLGISFVEVEGGPTSQAAISIAVGDLYGTVTIPENAGTQSSEGGLAVATRDRNGDGIADLGVLDFQDFDESIDDQFGGEFFRGSMFVVGQLLGYGYADDLPQPVTQSTSFIFTPGTDNEPAFPSVADIVHGQFLYRPDSTDIDLYKFVLPSAGSLSIETLAERLADPSLLDTSLRLYQMGRDGSFVEIAQNDDYFSNDSVIDVDNLQAGTYMIGVSARGNNDYDPTIEDSGFGGLSEGEYELSISFKPQATSGIRDASPGTSSQVLDGDGDNRPGGAFDFWFVPNDSNNTLYVDKASSATGGILGTIGSPYREIDQAIAAARPGDTIRVVGNGGVDGRVETTRDNFSYQIGFASNGTELADGSSLNLPQGVRMIIDSGAILKLSGARIGVGSVSPLIDASDSALQVLGTPTIIGVNGLPARDATNQIIPGSVFFTSIRDSSIGMGSSTAVGAAARPGDWGGIDFRGDLDASDESRRNREDEGVFLNHIQYADMRFGGGAVSIGGRQTAVSPIDMALTRPTIINSRISNSADAAIAATPDTFEETRFTEPEFQAGGAFTPDFKRVGPEISGNTVIDNSINGLFIRVVTRTGDVLEEVTRAIRFDDTDIPHVLTENLVIKGTPGGPILQSSAPSSLLVRLQPTVNGNIPAGTYAYRLTNVNSSGLESASSQTSVSTTLSSTGGIQLTQLPTTGAGSQFVSRRLYRATIDPATGLPGEFRLVSQLNASDTSFTDTVANLTTLLSTATQVLRSRLDASLTIDPGTVVKIDGARIEARFGGNLIAEGSPSLPVVFTSLEDQRYGGGGTFDTNGRGDSGELNPGDWGGIYIGAASSANIDQAVIAGAGGTTRIEGGFASFNAIEVQQGNLRLANSRLENNASGRGNLNGERVGRGDNAAATVFVRAAQPIIVDNTFVDGEAAALSFDINSLSSLEIDDPGRSTGRVDKSTVIGNAGPLVQGNVLDRNALNGLIVRGGQLATAGVWDDVDIVHVVTESIEIPNQHIFGGLRLESDARGSLVVKFESDEGETAGIVVGGSLTTASEEFRDIPDRIGGSLQVIGHPDFPVVLTTLADDTAGAGFMLDGRPQLDTNNDGVIGDDLANQSGDGFIQLPFGPEINQGLTIDNDVDVNTVGHFQATPQDGHLTTVTGVTVVDSTTGQVVTNQDYFFDFATYVIVGTTATRLSASTITQPATLIGDDLVESRGTFAGANGDVNWTAQTTFRDGVAVMFSSLVLDAAEGTTLGDVRVVNFFHPDVGIPGRENLYSIGNPGESNFRAVTYQVDQRFGFGHSGFFTNDGVNQVNANYVGWGSDTFANLETAIQNTTQTYSPAGTINQNNLPPINDPRLGPVFGTGDVNTAFAWDVDPTSATSTVTSFIELLPDQAAISRGAQIVESGLWDGIVIREAASDRNVASVAEEEPVRSAFIDANSIPSQSQFLGEIAPNEQSGDENRRLGFIVEGAISKRNDLDVYSFVGQSGTEVWLDIDRTGAQLDSVVELIDANGRVLASSNDSLLAESNRAALFVNESAGVNPDAAQPLSVVTERLAAQRITVSESIVDASGGSLQLSIDGNATSVSIPVEAFRQDPAAAVRNALENAFGTTLGDVSATLLRRSARVVDPNDPLVVTRPGGDFVVELRFDSQFFAGRSVPTISATTPTITGANVAASVASVVLDSQMQDTYSSNAKDAGMRIRLPGEAGTRNLYHVRVRSSNTRDPLNFTDLNDPNQVKGGLSTGAYQLQIRLQEADEHAGTQIRLADVRYADNGVHIIGQPLHSPLLGEEYEIPGDNDLRQDAQPLGYYSNNAVGEAGPLQSDRLAKSFGGTISGANDVDWYSFEVDYENLTDDGAPLYLSTVFDLDYADGFARADMAFYVFNQDGELILVGGDSNIADDLPGLASSSNTDDLSRGSAGTQDPYIGAAELAEGTYFVAISNQTSVPLPLDQFFNPTSANPLLRLEPIDSVRRIAEDRIGSVGGGTASDPVVPLLFDDSSIVPYSLDDVILYVNTGTDLRLVNPFTGISYGSVGDFGANLSEVAFRSNGELFGYTQTTNNDFFYHRIDTGDATLSPALSTDALIDLYRATSVVDPATGVVTFTSGIVDEALVVQAMAIGRFNQFNTPTIETGFLVGQRQNLDLVSQNAGARYSDNILYQFDPADGTAEGVRFAFTNLLTGAGSVPQEIGKINTDRFNDPNFPRGTVVQEFFDVLGIRLPGTNGNPEGLSDGDQFTIRNFGTGTTQSLTFEFNSGPAIIADANPTGSLVDGQTVSIDGRTFEINTGQRVALSQSITAGSTLRVEGSGGQATNLQFFTLGQPAPGNVGINLRDANNQPKTPTALAVEVADQINRSVGRVGATAVGGEVVFGGVVSPTLSTTGTGVSVLGNLGTNIASAIAVNVSPTATSNVLISRLANAIRNAGIEVSASGDRLTLASSTNVSFGVAPGNATPVPLTTAGDAGVTSGNREIRFRSDESAEAIAARVRTVINDVTAAELANVEAVIPATPSRTIRITGGEILGPTGENNITDSGSLVRSGVRLGGSVTGVEVVSGNNLYAVTNLGELYVVPNNQLRTVGDRGVGSLVDTATDLIGINFTALRSGPISYNDGELRETLFGITGNGDIYAFNTAGELQPIFAGGRSMISTGIGGAQGLDFSTLGFNLWHTTNQRGDDAGHGINSLYNGTRGASPGGTSLAFTFESNQFSNNFPTAVERPVTLDANGNPTDPRQDGQIVEDSYNFPGGAKGVIESRSFSLEEISSEDQPVLYFNYFLETDGIDAVVDNEVVDRDSLRVYVVTPGGVEHLVASNNTARLPGGPNDEFDDPAAVGQYDDAIDVKTQQLFDNTGTWRQARVELGSFAGMENLSLRIEFSTGGVTGTGSMSLRTKSGADLFHGQDFVIGGETFSIDFATAVGVPSGSQLAALYADPSARATVTIDGQVYVINDGTRVVDAAAGEISVPVLENAAPGVTLAGLTATQIAASLADVVLTSPPAATPITGLVFADPNDTVPPSTGPSNDRIVDAFALPYTGGSTTFVGSGQLGFDGNVGDFDSLADPQDVDARNGSDVDLLQLDVEAGTEINVNIAQAGDFNIQANVRFFDRDGNELAAMTQPNSGRLVSSISGTVFIGISGISNSTYDPVTGDGVDGSSPGTYEATIEIADGAGISIRSEGNLVELGGLETVVASPSNLFTVTGDDDVLGISVPLSRFMSAAEVASVLRQTLADRFANGDITTLPTNGNSILLPLLDVTDPGPFTVSSERSGDQFGAGPIGGARGNEFEGVYLDDFVIGFAERGEVATSSNVVDDAFVTDGRSGFPNPADPTSNLNTGSYQVEIRSASEYVDSASSTPFRTFDTNDRLTTSRSITALPADQIRDGSFFTIDDGRSTIEFEFDLVDGNSGITPGRVRIPYTLQAVQPGSEQIDGVTGNPVPGTGTLRPQTAAEVAQSIVDAINRADVQSIIDVPALNAIGVESGSSPVINLFGDVIVGNQDGGLAAVGRAELRGDDNRDRQGQGVILVENSRFLFNQGYGVKISHGLTANVDGQDTPSIVRYPRNLVELNTESIVPGVIIQSNIMAFNEAGGLQVDGIPLNLDDTASDPIAFDRIVNNTIIGGRITAGVDAPPQTFQGVLFPQGAISFADSVVDYSFDAGGASPSPVYRDSSKALGAPDAGGRGVEPVDGQTTVSLGRGGTLTLQFGDNLLTGSGDSRPDLIVYETGAIESVQVAISRDGVQFESVGTLGGLTNQIDIDAFGFGTQDRFAFVRLTDLRQGPSVGGPLGADIDAVGAISSVSVESFTAGGTGIELVGNAAPVLLNNVIANTETGVQLDPANQLPILGGNTFYRNTDDVPAGVSIGEFAQQLADAEVIFVGAADLVFAPAAGARIIDSSIDSLEDRASLTTVKNPLGLPPSPILAPRLDVNGQLRVDDPNVETPSGLGERVFKDRGASDRGDLVGPRVVLLSPQAPNLGLDSGAVSVIGDTAPRFFELQLIDGIAPADVTPGTGIDDRSVTNQSVLLLKDNVALIEGVDYRFGYNPSTNVIRLTPIAGVFEQNSTYSIRIIDASDAIVAASDGNTYVDGDVLTIRDASGQTTDFEYERGITLQVPAGTIEANLGEGVSITVFDGVNTVTFELDNNDVTGAANIPVTIPDEGSDDLIAQAIANAVNATNLNLTANVSGSLVQFLGTNPLAAVTVNPARFPVTGAIGTQTGFGLQIPNNGALVDGSVDDGQTFVVRRGATTAVTFEIDIDGTLDNAGATAVRIPVGATLDQLADAIVRAVGGAGLGLAPSNAGFGRVFLGGDANYSVDVSNTVLTQTSSPGLDATVPIVIPINLSAAEISPLIADAIEGIGLPGVTTSIVDSRVFIEGISGASGVGSVDTVTIRDEVGNLLQSNQTNGRTELTIFVGGGFDYGDAPGQYRTLAVNDGPRHAVDESLRLGATVSADNDAKLPNADDDDGVIVGQARGGFATNVQVEIRNSGTTTNDFYLDAWFDWNANGVFEFSESRRFGSAGTGRTEQVGVGINNFIVNVPAGASVGEIYARFRLSDARDENGNLRPDLAPTGNGAVGDLQPVIGEVEDVRIVVANNPFQNPVSRFDVNDSGIVTPLDALQIINAIDRNSGQVINLNSVPLPDPLPVYPDVNGDGRVTVLDALQVINHLAMLPNTSGGSSELVGEGERTTFVPIASGLLASGATRIGDELIAQSQGTETVSTVDPPASKTSVFDSVAVVELDSIVDSLAQDSAAARDRADDPIDTLDQLFASF